MVVLAPWEFLEVLDNCVLVLFRNLVEILKLYDHILGKINKIETVN